MKLKNKVILYVKSEKIPVIQYSESVSGHPCTGAYQATDTISGYKPEDQEIIEFLEKAGITYKLVDLSNCPLTAQLKAKIAGINETPTLVLNGAKIKGLEDIRQALQRIEA